MKYIQNLQQNLPHFMGIKAIYKYKRLVVLPIRVDMNEWKTPIARDHINIILNNHKMDFHMSMKHLLLYKTIMKLRNIAS